MAVIPKVAVLVFPGTNCEHETLRAVEQAGAKAEVVWHTKDNLDGYDAVIIPGGFSYGDYLRAGVLARVSPIMDAVRGFADSDKPVLGICNGFQILLESGLLPGALVSNSSLTFVHRWQPLQVERSLDLWWDEQDLQPVFPIAHHQGNYFAPPELLTELEENNQIMLRYRADDNWPEATENPNGSIHRIAGVTNRKGNVLGMMPHPERACMEQAHLATGKPLFRSLIQHLLKGSR